MTAIPKRLQNSLNRIRKCGGVVLVHHAHTGTVDFQLQNGGGLAESTVLKLRAAGLLEPGCDGLFGGDDQTLHVVEG